MLSIVLTCWLGAVLLSPCDGETAEVAAVYSPYTYAIPGAHLALVRGLYWTTNRGGESWYQTGRVGLPRRDSLHVLSHEVGHLVTLRGGLIDRFNDRFWPGGHPVEGTPTKYARTNVYEDAAESYAYVVMGDTADMPARRAWIIRELPELAH